ncbi:metal-dependent hydrolase [Nocardioides yefusunii]|uniref:Metal-dependent hydrolase n=2 Tax=Nocardioides yefusunii TaxID=2500546 RepID=A0ABW1QZG0_9ACTN|nr:metal-dependent hydrolase [Nocardioides yefusunii]
MGVTHATSGAALWIATTGVLPYLDTGIHPLPASAVLAGSIITAGAALLPDLDHHSATIAHSVPLVGRTIAAIANNVGGGHRQGFHAPLMLVGVWFLASWMSRWQWDIGEFTVAAGAGLTALALCSFGVKARRYVSSWAKAWAVGLAYAALVLAMSPQGPSWLPLAVTMGYAVHLVGDILTTGGLPVLWPITIRPPRWVRRTPVLSAVWRPGGHVAVPLLGDAGSRREKVLGVLMSTYVSFGVVAETCRMFGL